MAICNVESQDRIVHLANLRSLARDGARSRGEFDVAMSVGGTTIEGCAVLEGNRGEWSSIELSSEIADALVAFEGDETEWLAHSNAVFLACDAAVPCPA